MTDGYHATVEYYPDGFTGANTGDNPSDSTMYYRMWYWDVGTLYAVSAIGFTESPDGVNWFNYQPCQNMAGGIPIVTGVHPEWNRGSYGPCDILYNPSASNTGTDWTFTMYYDGTTGGDEAIGIGFSEDGITWTGYDTGTDGKADPVLNGTYVSGDWDYNYVSRATIIKNADDDYEMWYSGGVGAMNHGIGYATSTDGIHWTRDASNPVFHKDDTGYPGEPWRQSRTYCPMVIKDGTTYKMWFTGVGSAYSIGYATGAPPPSEVWVDDDYCASCPNDGHTWGYDAFDTIQDGIDAVAGSTVHVAAGTYEESITANKSLTLLGAKSNVDPRGGAWTGDISVINPGPGGYGVDIRVSNVTINGFEINGGMYGIYVAPGAGDVSDVTIEYNDLHTNTKYGCQLIDQVAGVSLTGVNISKNYFHDNGRNGLKMVSVANSLADSNEFAYNGFGAYATKPEYKYGILLEDERYNNPIYGPAINNTFTGNTFHDNNLGAINMEVLGNASGTYWTSTEFLEGTVVNYNNFHGDLHVWGINVDNDYKDDGTQDGFGPIATVDATCNWWGDASGPEDASGTNEVPPCTADPATEKNDDGIGDKVSDNVDYCPWLITSWPYVEFAQFTIDHAKLDFKKKPDDDKVHV